MGKFCLFFHLRFVPFSLTQREVSPKLGFDFLQDGDCITGIRQLPELTSTTTGSAFVLWCHGKPSTPITWGNAAAGDSTSVQGHLRLVDIQVGAKQPGGGAVESISETLCLNRKKHHVKGILVVFR